jgi:hypothetical protein
MKAATVGAFPLLVVTIFRRIMLSPFMAARRDAW